MQYQVHPYILSCIEGYSPACSEVDRLVTFSTLSLCNLLWWWLITYVMTSYHHHQCWFSLRNFLFFCFARCSDGQPQWGSWELFININSLAPGRFEWHFRWLIFKWFGTEVSHAIVFRWVSLDFTEDKSTLVQVMTWCHQATGHYLSQCWPRSVSPYNAIRPQWVKQQGIFSKCYFISYYVHCKCNWYEQCLK